MSKQVNYEMNTLLHRSFKRELVRIQQGLKNAEADDRIPVGLIRRWQFFSDQLKHHHEAEDTYLWPLVEERSKDQSELVVMSAMESEHAAMHRKIDALDQSFATAANGESVDIAAMLTHLGQLSGIVAGHCDHEERDAVPLLEKYVKREDLGDFMKFTRSGPDNMLVFPWVSDGATEADRKAVWGVLPGPVRLFLRPMMNKKYDRFLEETRS
ncbi:MAG: hemerythrin domain-containing protein [Actinobacteria bacterium]|mgnify:CR=1 FL=1|nr:hemerythrin domain-containing protein [Actinomycetota bacterium]